jgi:hypothetical protein
MLTFKTLNLQLNLIIALKVSKYKHESIRKLDGGFDFIANQIRAEVKNLPLFVLIVVLKWTKKRITVVICCSLK